MLSAPRPSARRAAPPSSQAVQPASTASTIFSTPRRYKTRRKDKRKYRSSFASEVMISDLLAKAGYNCGYVGKWHMGNDRQPGHGYKYTYTMSGGIGTLHRP